MIDEKPPGWEGDEPKEPEFIDNIDNKPVTPDEVQKAEDSFQKKLSATKEIKPKDEINWKALVAVGLTLITGVGYAGKEVAGCVHDAATVSPAEAFEHSEKRMREDSRLTEKQENYMKNMDEIIRTASYKGENIGALYSMVYTFQFDRSAREGFQKSADNIEALIENKKIGTEEGLFEVLAPIREKVEQSERGELDYPFTEEEAKYRVETIGNILSVDNNMPPREKAELTAMATLSEDFSFNRYENSEVWNS